MIRIGIQLEFAGGYGRGILRGVMEYAHLRADWKFVMPPMYALAKRALSDPDAADGVIVMVHAARSIERFQRARIPIVNTARTMSSRELREAGLPSVLPDDGAVGKMAFDYFRKRGFRSFGFCGHPTASWSRLRCSVFASECRKNGFTASVSTASDQVPSQWVRSLPRPCAVLCANDRYAWHFIDACRENDISVPEEIAVLGVDNDVLLTKMVHPTLSSIDLGAERIGYAAAQTLDDLIHHRKVPRDPVEFPPIDVETRHSTDISSIEDEVVAEAVRFIREHANSMISVDDILRELVISRRSLERRFRRTMGYSLLEEIREVHLDRARRLLRETNLDIPHVAEQSGFASHVRFSTVFREKMGMTPTSYRRSDRVFKGDEESRAPRTEPQE
jgi:LacI family transcriptional regulator